jgi:hypothetical protein
MAKVSEEFDEVFHYTGAAGLAGIVTSGTLRATHFAFLNDQEEYNLFFDQRLPVIIRWAVDKAFTEYRSRAAIVARVDAAPDVESAKKEALEMLLDLLNMGLRDFEAPFITSFCTGMSDQVKRHGLLSQWRGYGSDGGYAIAFDTARLEEVWERESKLVTNAHVTFGNVEYLHDVQSKNVRYKETRLRTKKIVDNLATFLLDLDAGTLGKIMSPAVLLACSMKHWGFEEENEVRFIITHPSADMQAAMPGEFTVKPIHAFEREGVPVPFMALNALAPEGSLPLKLPINRVIVGPHPDRAARKIAVEVLLHQHGYAVPVQMSEIPYRGR